MQLAAQVWSDSEEMISPRVVSKMGPLVLPEAQQPDANDEPAPLPNPHGAPHCGVPEEEQVLCGDLRLGVQRLPQRVPKQAPPQHPQDEAEEVAPPGGPGPWDCGARRLLLQVPALASQDVAHQERE